jgi:cytochrome P450
VTKNIENISKKENKYDNLLAELLQMVQTGKITPEQLHTETVTLLVAGYESISVNLSWTFYLLTQYPNMIKKVQAEIETVLTGNNPTFADIAKLSYTRMVIQESLRMYAPSYWLQRMAKEEDEIDGFHIPAGGIVVPMIHLVHHHPKIWEKPTQFRPARFLSQNVKNRHKLAWMPFGAGHRKCIAMEFSLVTGQLILAMILQRYDVTAILGRIPKIQLGSNLRPKGGVWINLEKRIK